MTIELSYQSILETSQRNNWHVGDLIGDDKTLDFSKPFLPERFACTQALQFLNAEERLALNHIRAHGYLAWFELFEAVVSPFMSEQAESKDADPFRAPALRNFVAEEAKHMALFSRFRQTFVQAFGSPCAVIGPAREIRDAVLAHSPLAVAILILGIEWMSQGHYVESVKDAAELDPMFKDMLKHHWIEEAQHAKIDGLLLRSLVVNETAIGVEKAVAEYLDLIAVFDGGLKAQANLDLQSLEAHMARELSDVNRVLFVKHQHQALRRTFLGSAMQNTNFLEVLEILGASARNKVQEAACGYC